MDQFELAKIEAVCAQLTWCTDLKSLPEPNELYACHGSINRTKCHIPIFYANTAHTPLTELKTPINCM